MSTAALVLEDGRVFLGESFGKEGKTLGEVVFSTGMTGYQETLTDPSYAGQIVVSTAPQIGNTGWNDEDNESGGIHVSGYVVRDPARRASNWRSTTSLTDELVRQEIVGLAGIDTRALTRHVRELGAMRGGIFSGGELTDVDSMVAQVKASPIMEGASWAGEVSTKNTYVVPAVGEKKFTVVALDLGIKANTPRMMSERGIEVHVLNNAATIDDILAINPDGVFLSNGPGDPATAEHEVAVTKEVLARKIPFFGICFGNQILGRALGVKTYKMKYGHRGINVPIIDTRTGKVAITAQNHGFAIEGTAGETFETPYGTALFSHYCPNDGTIEGLQLLDGPAFSVQYHPEAAAGPHDAANLFDEFVALMSEGK